MKAALSLAQQVSMAAHAKLPHANPLSVSHMADLVQALVARSPRSVLEVGCGSGAFALALARGCEAAITATDTHAGFLARAEQDKLGQALKGQVAFCEQPASNFANQRFDAVVCIGASQAFGLPIDALNRCAAMLNPDGTLVFAELVWSAPPPDAFVAFLGVQRTDYWPLAEVPDIFRGAGLSVLAQTVAASSDWQAYETAVFEGRMAFAAALPADQANQAEQLRQRAQTWRDAYQRHGQHCLGFTATVASKPVR